MSPTATLTAPAVTTPPSPSNPDLAGSAAERLVLIVAPSNGRFRPVAAQGTVEAGALVGQITGGRGRCDDVPSPARVVLQGLLALPGHLVVRGQALAWAHAIDASAAA